MRPKDPGKTARMRRELREELKGKKTVVTIYIILRVLVILTMVAQFLNGNFENVFLCILTLVLFTLPTVIERRVRIDLPDTLEIIILLFILIKAFVFLIECAPAVTDHNPSAGIKVHMLTHRMNSGLLIFTRFTQYGQKPANHQIIDFLFIW